MANNAGHPDSDLATDINPHKVELKGGVEMSGGKRDYILQQNVCWFSSSGSCSFQERIRRRSTFTGILQKSSHNIQHFPKCRQQKVVHSNLC